MVSCAAGSAFTVMPRRLASSRSVLIFMPHNLKLSSLSLHLNWPTCSLLINGTYSFPVNIVVNTC
ncbi:hypothetical protein GIB67_028132 [Kingdonia uniflora]|uniref:Uncharacterized protein n=1 Tax=Kingdonia uniflora TaxID=39325 RepID=A0A7J7KZN6_9MAGN|nr:hypothetical protein GIB67_028132 [Kingdonia uniflora]